MKTKRNMKLWAALVLLSAAAIVPAAAQGRGRGGAGNGVSQETSIIEVVEEIESGKLSEAEQEGIILMREEEKLARDVYLTLSEKWNIPIFANIARSEETHMEAMAFLIDRYGLEDPVHSPARSERGDYSNPEFDTLYADLTERGARSLEDALEIGALIEDLDIADLQRLIEESGNGDVKVVYQNLLKGSRNHLRSFNSQLERYGGEYRPEYISAEYLEKIISSRNEAGVISDPDYLF